MRAFHRNLCAKRYLPWLVVALLCFGLALSLRFGFRKRPPPPAFRLTARVLHYSFSLQNTTGRCIRKVVFQAAAPVKRTATQRCLRIESSHHFQLSCDRYGNQILHFKPLDFAPHAAKVIAIDVRLLISARPAAGTVLSADLTPEKYIECDRPAVRRLARRLKGRRTLESAQAIWRWVHGHIRFAGYRKRRRGAFLTLHQQRGDCTGQADLFTALCRALRIPARSMAGYVCPQSSVLAPQQYHNWSEFYTRGAWRLADPQGAVFCKRQSDYIAMRVVGRHDGQPAPEFDRFAVSDHRIAVRMNPPPLAAAGRRTWQVREIRA